MDQVQLEGNIISVDRVEKVIVVTAYSSEEAEALAAYGWILRTELEQEQADHGPPH